MYRAVKPLGIAQEEVARAVEITNKAFKAGGAAVSEQNNAILQLSQSLGSGILQGDELRSVRENAPLVAQAIADEFDTTIAGLKKLGEQGELTTDRVFKAIIDGGADIDAQFAVTLPTIADGFTNLQTALIQFVGKGNEASGVSLAIGAALNFVAQNLDGLVKTIILAGTAWGVYYVAAAIKATQATGGLAASQTVVAIRSAIAATAAALTSKSFYTMATAATVARGALTLLLGPIGIAIAAATGLAILFGVMEDGAESTRQLGAEAQSTKAKLGTLQAGIEDLDDARINRVGSAMQGMSERTESAAEKVDRLAKAMEDADLKAFEDKLRQVDEVIAETESQIEGLREAFVNAGKFDIFGTGEEARVKKLTAALGVLNGRIREAEATREKLKEQGSDGSDPEAQKRYNEAIFKEIDVRLFAARNNAQAELAILKEKAQMAMNIYGDESDEYIRAVKEKETAEQQLNRDAISGARDRARAIKDAQKDELEQYDLRMEQEGENAAGVLAIMEEKLAKLKEFYGEDSREYARGLQDKIRLTEKFQREANRIASDGIKTQAEMGKLALEADIAYGEQGLARKRAAVDAAVEVGRINEVQALQLKAAIDAEEAALEQAHATALYAIQRKSLEDFLALEGLRPEERAKALNDIERLEIEHANKLSTIQGKAGITAVKNQDAVAAAVQKSWAGIVDPIGNSFGQMFRSLYNGTEGWRESFLKVLDNILFSFVDMGIQMATKWAAQQLAMTAASVAGSTARTAATATEAATTTTISAGQALGQILNYAYTAAAGAFSAMAGIPIIGPVLAVGAGAAALAAVLGFAGKIFSAKGGFGKVPMDGAVTELHKDEMVLPAEYASPLRDMLTSVSAPRGPGALARAASDSYSSFQSSTSESNSVKGDVILNYTPAPGAGSQQGGLDRMLRKDSRTLKKWMKNEIRNGGLKSVGSVK